MVNIISKNTVINYFNDSDVGTLCTDKTNDTNETNEGIKKCKTTKSWYVKYKVTTKKWKRSVYFKNKLLALRFWKKISNNKKKNPSNTRCNFRHFFKKTKRNKIPYWIKDQVSYDQSWNCNICSNMLEPGRITDHIIPLQFGGENNISNYQTICERCNRFKTFHFDNKIIKPMLKKNKKLTSKYFLNIQKKEYNKILNKRVQ
jgi:5-methylcytosine-specific restriction endonuclease McrA